MTHRTLQILAVLLFLTLVGVPNAYSAVPITVYSGTFDGEHPDPVFVQKVTRGQRFDLRLMSASAVVNYPDPDRPVIVERSTASEIGGVVTCPWYIKLDGTPGGTRENREFSEKITHRVVCDDGTCTDVAGRPKGPGDLLFGKYDLPRCKMSDGTDFGYGANLWIDKETTNCPPHQVCGPEIQILSICCQEFAVERQFSELHYFDKLLIVEGTREQELTDLDVDLKKMYLTFVNANQEASTCQLSDLFSVADTIAIKDAKDCVLPAGDQFSMYAQSRFFWKETRPCGKFVAKARRLAGGDWSPDWFLGHYECDGKSSRSPITRQYTYPTRVDIEFNDNTIQGVI